MKNLTFLIIIVTCCSTLFARNSINELAPESHEDIYTDTWVATDALGRKMPSIDEVGPLKKDHRRVVGMFYITWHDDSKAKHELIDVTQVLESDPKARLDHGHKLWGKGNAQGHKSAHWGEPEMGYFLSKDKYVIRKDMSLLADAGVDVLLMDVTNAVHYWEEWEVVFSTMQEMKDEGNTVPEFCFWAYNGDVVNVVMQLHERIYLEEKYKDLWFHWDDKPLLLYNPHHEYPDDIKEFFTRRGMWWGGPKFVGEGNWSFGYAMQHQREAHPDELVSMYNGKQEEVAVTPAQHSSTMIGKSWSRKSEEPDLDEYDMPVDTYVPWLGKKVKNPEAYGIYFQERWDEALAVDPQFVSVNDWNEWTAGIWPSKEKEKIKFMNRMMGSLFVDQYNAEFNRGIQPMKGGYTDNYYMQMAQNIRRYKGVRPIPENYGYQGVRIDGKFDEWDQIPVEYRDTIGDTFHRDYPGYGGLKYKDNSGRNDIVRSKIAVSEDYVYFYVETSDLMSSYNTNNWMLLLIDADQDPSTGWNGYDFLINKKVLSKNRTTLSAYIQENGSGSWVMKGEIDYRYRGKALELALPRKSLGLDGDAFSFDFHWSDNASDLNDIISLCTSGDSAPNRRFNYRFVWHENK